MEVKYQISDVKISNAFLVLLCLAGQMGNIVGCSTTQLCREVCFRISINYNRLDPDPHWEGGSGSRRVNMAHINRKK
jgi:hypothetical protein